MYRSAEARPGPSQESKISVFTRIVNVFKLMFLIIFAKSTIMDVSRVLITPLTCSNTELIQFFPLHE